MLSRSFFARDATIVAKDLLGKILVFESLNGIKRVKIIETESYPVGDSASHAFKGKSVRSKVMFGDAGKAYIYVIYGRYYCLNVVTGNKGGEAVLLRAAEPIIGITLPTNGPAKLVQALGVSLDMNGLDMTTPPFYFEEGEKIDPQQVITTTRIGINKSKEKPLRFFIKNNPLVSKV